MPSYFFRADPYLVLCRKKIQPSSRQRRNNFNVRKLSGMPFKLGRTLQKTASPATEGAAKIGRSHICRSCAYVGGVSSYGVGLWLPQMEKINRSPGDDKEGDQYVQGSPF